MKDRSFGSLIVLAALAVTLSLVPVPAVGQAQTAAGSQWTGPRTPDGQPDVQGTWSTSGHPAGVSGTFSVEAPRAGGLVGFADEPPAGATRVVDPPDGRIPYQPWAAALVRAQEKDALNPTKAWHIDTQHRCLPRGVARGIYGTQVRILQFPGYVVLLSETYERYRIIRLGAPHIEPQIKLWMGDPVGRWEGNTLVVDLTNVNGKPRLSIVGDFYSENAHIVEHFTFIDAKTLNYTATFNDPTVYMRPWTLAVFLGRVPDEEFWESACREGERGLLWPTDTGDAPR